MGEHLVSILKNNAHIPNSPISIMVVQSEIGDASLVKVHGDGLIQATTTSKASFIVDTREAGQCQRRLGAGPCFQRLPLFVTLETSLAYFASISQKCTKNTVAKPMSSSAERPQGQDPNRQP